MQTNEASNEAGRMNALRAIALSRAAWEMEALGFRLAALLVEVV